MISVPFQPRGFGEMDKTDFMEMLRVNAIVDEMGRKSRWEGTHGTSRPPPFGKQEWAAIKNFNSRALREKFGTTGSTRPSTAPAPVIPATRTSRMRSRRKREYVFEAEGGGDDRARLDALSALTLRQKRSPAYSFGVRRDGRRKLERWQTVGGAPLGDAIDRTSRYKRSPSHKIAGKLPVRAARRRARRGAWLTQRADVLRPGPRREVEE